MLQNKLETIIQDNFIYMHCLLYYCYTSQYITISKYFMLLFLSILQYYLPNWYYYK